MREYVEGKVDEFNAKLIRVRGVLDDLSRQGNHPVLVKALYRVSRQVENLIHGSQRLLPFNIQMTFGTQKAKFTRIRASIELLEEWYLPALMNEGPEERAMSRVIGCVLDQLGVSWLADKVVSFTRGHSFFEGTGQCAIFFVPRYARENLLDWLGFYHEIGHAVFQRFPEIGSHLSETVIEYCEEQNARLPSLTQAQAERRLDRDVQTLRYWDGLRLEELFCDVFATVVGGPAYLFSWVDESVTSRVGPYQVLLRDDHPPNAARTQACILALNDCFASSPLTIASTAIWEKFLEGFTKEIIFNQMCAQPLILAVVRAAQDEIENHGFPAYTKPLPAPAESLTFRRIDDAQELVNVAMVNLGFAPQEFPAWQERIVQRLFAEAGSAAGERP